MDRTGAQAEADRLNVEHPERERFRWAVAGNDDEGWTVARYPVLQGKRLDPLKETIESHAQPNPADDPRPSQWRDVPPYGAG